MKTLMAWILAAGLSSTAVADTALPPFADRVEALAFSTGLTSAQRRDRIVALYRAEFRGPLATRDVDALRHRLDGALTAAFYSKDRAVARDAATLHRALAAQGALRRDDTDHVLASLIKARAFEQADQLARAYGKPALPPVIRAPRPLLKRGPRVIVVDDGRLTIRPAERRPFQDGVVVVSSPSCRFSSAAAAAIARDPALRAALHGSLWLVPPEGQLHAREVRQWNLDHAGQQMVLAYDWLEWPDIDDWSTPAFYFFAGGHLVDQVSGWPLDGRGMPQLRRAVAAWREAGGAPAARASAASPRAEVDRHAETRLEIGAVPVQAEVE